MLRDKTEFCNLYCWIMKKIEDSVPGRPSSFWMSPVLVDDTRTGLWSPKFKGGTCLFSDIKIPERKAPLVYPLYYGCCWGWEGERGHLWQSRGLTPSCISTRTFAIGSCHLLARYILEGLFLRNCLFILREMHMTVCFKTKSSTDLWLLFYFVLRLSPMHLRLVLNSLGMQLRSLNTCPSWVTRMLEFQAGL